MAKILVVEDSPEVRKLLEEFSEEYGHILFGNMGSLEEVRRWVELGEAPSIEVAIINISLAPGVPLEESGRMVVRVLEDHGFDGKVIYTSSFHPMSFPPGVRREADVFLRKPFELADLQRAIRELVGDL